jgi:Fe2+ or Zn2+ uptake regulation protein
MRQGQDIICNCCGKTLKRTNDIVMEDFFHMEKTWGFFSRKDGSCEYADICEDCMEQWMKGFQIPAKTVERTELFEC